MAYDGKIKNEQLSPDLGDRIDLIDNAKHTHSNSTALNAVSGTNTGDETVITLGAKIGDTTVTTTPSDADNVVSITSSNGLRKTTWSNIKATLKTYFDTLYTGQSSTASSIQVLESDPVSPSLGEMWLLVVPDYVYTAGSYISDTFTAADGTALDNTRWQTAIAGLDTIGDGTGVSIISNRAQIKVVTPSTQYVYASFKPLSKFTRTTEQIHASWKLVTTSAIFSGITIAAETIGTIPAGASANGHTNGIEVFTTTNGQIYVQKKIGGVLSGELSTGYIVHDGTSENLIDVVTNGSSITVKLNGVQIYQNFSLGVTLGTSVDVALFGMENHAGTYMYNVDNVLVEVVSA